jgi:hypothetical protein
MAEIKRLLKALYRGKFTSATFSLLDPIPFFAEFALWLSSGLSRQKKAKSFLQLNPASSELGQPVGATNSDWAGDLPADAAVWTLADVCAAKPPVFARVSLADLQSSRAQRSDSRAKRNA